MMACERAASPLAKAFTFSQALHGVLHFDEEDVAFGFGVEVVFWRKAMGEMQTW